MPKKAISAEWINLKPLSIMPKKETGCTPAKETFRLIPSSLPQKLVSDQAFANMWLRCMLKTYELTINKLRHEEIYTTCVVYWFIGRWM
jgi:hypothetical protein